MVGQVNDTEALTHMEDGRIDRTETKPTNTPQHH